MKKKWNSLELSSNLWNSRESVILYLSSGFEKVWFFSHVGMHLLCPLVMNGFVTSPNFGNLTNRVVSLLLCNADRSSQFSEMILICEKTGSEFPAVFCEFNELYIGMVNALDPSLRESPKASMSQRRDRNERT